MTNPCKHERRATRRTLQAAVLANHFSLALRLRSTPRQLRSYARKVTDQLLAGRNPATVISVN